MVRADEDRTLSCKKSAGGLILYVNTKWCNPRHVTVKEIICTPDIELLAVGLRPYYLPREFSHAIVVVVYIPPSANAARACDIIHSTVVRLQTDHPFLTINGDFNHAKLPKTLTGFTQYVKCSTKENKILDMMYANVKEAYSSSALPPWAPLTTTSYIQARCQAPACHHQDWCITLYIRTCEESIIPTKKVRCFPNNKPWINKNIKALLNRKKRAFMAKDRKGVKSVQKELKGELRRAKKGYKEKIEGKLEDNNTREVWDGLKKITGQKQSGLDKGGLNLFFNRFDVSPPTPTPPTPPAGRVS
ncbi:hypothetical protein AAFF_G00180680 [Aldrovandia affinis]|uniref:Endonuclease/exonuclease/phosphatase domain-containing protein n=1 Tax=Aldrovandia affinis TaxID=143900 RepID=A0AAD7SZ64_9TELE|nr:hypothetical protein AAFF_G00180680 [Aldrovandia affinis]